MNRGDWSNNWLMNSNCSNIPTKLLRHHISTWKWSIYNFFFQVNRQSWIEVPENHLRNAISIPTGIWITQSKSHFFRLKKNSHFYHNIPWFPSKKKSPKFRQKITTKKQDKQLSLSNSHRIGLQKNRTTIRRKNKLNRKKRRLHLIFVSSFFWHHPLYIYHPCRSKTSIN